MREGEDTMSVETAAERARTRDWADVALVAGAVILTLSTAYIHTTLGSLLFTMNAVGYTVLAAALVVPIGLAERYRWLIRLGLLGFVLATIGGWILFGARYDVAYFDKAIEVVLIGFLLVAIWRMDGGPAGVVAHLRALPGEVSDLLRGRR
jgi:hypothetical protein